MKIYQLTNSDFKHFTLVVMLLFLPSLGSFAQADASHLNLAKNKLALQGFDPVSYFQDKPLKGNSKFKTAIQGVVYQFANAKHQKEFEANPEKYIPAYGGWCAYAMGATGDKVEVNPKTYKILDGKLYLFYNKYFTNTLDSWNDDEENLKTKADKNWRETIK